MDGLEREASDEIAKRLGKGAQGFYLPGDITTRSFRVSQALSQSDMIAILAETNRLFQRALTAGSASGGGFTVQQSVLGKSMIELLRNHPLVAQSGATIFDNLEGDVAVPRQNGASTPQTLSENGVATSSDPSFGQLILTPHRVSGFTTYSKQLLTQSSIGIETFVRLDLTRVQIIEKDRQALFGTGTGGDPRSSTDAVPSMCSRSRGAF